MVRPWGDDEEICRRNGLVMPVRERQPLARDSPRKAVRCDVCAPLIRAEDGDAVHGGVLAGAGSVPARLLFGHPDPDEAWIGRASWRASRKVAQSRDHTGSASAGPSGRMACARRCNVPGWLPWEATGMRCQVEILETARGGRFMIARTASSLTRSAHDRA